MLIVCHGVERRDGASRQLPQLLSRPCTHDRPGSIRKADSCPHIRSRWSLDCTNCTFRPFGLSCVRLRSRALRVCSMVSAALSKRQRRQVSATGWVRGAALDACEALASIIPRSDWASLPAAAGPAGAGGGSSSGEWDVGRCTVQCPWPCLPWHHMRGGVLGSLHPAASPPPRLPLCRTSIRSAPSQQRLWRRQPPAAASRSASNA